MKEKIKFQKGFIQLPIIIVVTVSLLAITGIGYGMLEYHKASKIVEEADQLSKKEKYNEAIEKLKLAQDKWFIKILGIKREEISDKIERNKELFEDKLEYTQGIEEFNKGNWEKAKELLLKVSENSPYYQEAKNKLNEIQSKITERQISEVIAKIMKTQTVSPVSPASVSPKRDEIQDKEEIKTLLKTWIDTLNKGIEKMNTTDFKTLYETYTPNYRSMVSFQQFKKEFEEFSSICNFFEIGPPIMINVRGIVQWLYENDPQFLNIKNQMSFSQFWETIKKAKSLGLKEKITVKEWNENFPDKPFSEDELRSFLPFCKGGRIEAKEIKIRIEKFSEGRWAKVTYKIKINNQEVSELNATEENPDIYREINGKWYCVEIDEKRPGFNLADLPPDIRGFVKLKQEEKNQEKKKEESFSSVGYQTSEIVENLGKYIVRISCVDSLGNWVYGSGIIIARSTELEGTRENTLILTNYHLIENATPLLSTPCFVEYSSDPTKGFTDFYWATPVYFPTAFSENEMKVLDFAFLSVEEKTDKNGNIIPNASLLISEFGPQICGINDVKVGEEIVVLGYPTIGGMYLTATEGVISGFDGDYYLTTSAKIEKGNSGGGVFLKSTGCLVGMPTFAKLGEIESFARLINMPYLDQNYLSRVLK